MYLRLFTLSQKKTNCYSWKMSPHYLVKCTTFSSDWMYVAFLQTLVALKKAGCGLALVAVKRTGCDVWQMECQTSSVTANVQNDHLLHRYMLPVFSPLITASSIMLFWKSAHVATRRFSNSSVSRIGTGYVKIWKRWQICAFYKVVWWHFSGVVGKGVTVCFLLR